MNAILLILLTAALLVLLGVMTELGTRWWLKRRSQCYVWPPGLRLHLHPDRKLFPELEPSVRIEINRDGERGDEVPDSTAGLYRILVAGGSPVECGLIDQPSSWPHALQAFLEKPERLGILKASKVHAGSIGRSGIASQHLDLIFERVLPRYRHLSAIVIMVGGNDVFKWLEDGAPVAVQSPPRLASEAFSIHGEGPFGWKPREMALVQLLKRLKFRFQPTKVRHNSARWVGTARTMRAKAKEVKTAVPDPSAMLDNFEVHFRNLLKRAKTYADRVLVVRQPWFEKNYTPEEDAHIWHGGMNDGSKKKGITVFYSIDVVNMLMTKMDLRAAKVASELGIEHLNLMPVLDRSLRTYYDYVHFTPAGAAAVAAAVADAILRRDQAPKQLSRIHEHVPQLTLLPPAQGKRTAWSGGRRRIE